MPDGPSAHDRASEPGAASQARLWLIVLGLSLGPAVSNGFARFAYGLLLPAMREDLGWSYTEAGWINTANALGYLIGALLALNTIGRIGASRLFVGGMILIALALTGSGLSRDFWVLSVFRVLAGIGGAPVFIAGGVLVSALFRADASRSALAIAVYFGGGGLGLLICGVSLPMMLDRMGSAAWPTTWLLLGIASSIALVPAWFSVRALRLPAVSGSAAPAVPLPVRAILPALVGYSLFAVGYIVYLTFLVAWMRAGGATTELVSLTWAVLGIGVMLSPFVWRRILAASSGGLPLALAIAATGAGTLLPLGVEGAAGLVLSAAVFGLSFFMAPTAVTTFSRKNLAQAQWGPSVALFTTVFAVGQMIGPVAAGAIADRWDSITLGLVAAGAILLLGGLIASAQRPLGEIEARGGSRQGRSK